MCCAPSPQISLKKTTTKKMVVFYLVRLSGTADEDTSAVPVVGTARNIETSSHRDNLDQLKVGPTTVYSPN